MTFPIQNNDQKWGKKKRRDKEGFSNYILTYPLLSKIKCNLIRNLRWWQIWTCNWCKSLAWDSPNRQTLAENNAKKAQRCSCLLSHHKMLNQYIAINTNSLNRFFPTKPNNQNPIMQRIFTNKIKTSNQSITINNNQAR